MEEHKTFDFLIQWNSDRWQN